LYKNVLIPPQIRCGKRDLKKMLSGCPTPQSIGFGTQASLKM
jgi:hypothetical protein